MTTRRPVLLVLGAVVVALTAPAAAHAAASATIDSAIAHQRDDGRVEVYVRARHSGDARVDGRVRVAVLDHHGRTVATGRAHRVAHTATDAHGRHRVDYHVVLPARSSRRAAALLSRDHRLRLRVRYRAAVGAGGRTAVAAAAAVAAPEAARTLTITGGASGTITVTLSNGPSFTGCTAQAFSAFTTLKILCENDDAGFELVGTLTTGPVAVGGYLDDLEINAGELLGNVSFDAGGNVTAIDESGPVAVSSSND